MSEQNSLFIKINIKQENLHRFFNAKPKRVVLDDNWLTWWETREMYSKTELTEVKAYRVETNREIIDMFLKETNMGPLEYYDEQINTWYCMIMLFSENYIEILPMLAWLKNLAEYQEGDESGFAVLYDFVWDNGSVMAHMDFSKGQAKLSNVTTSSAINPTQLEEANQKLNALMDNLQNHHED